MLVRDLLLEVSKVFLSTVVDFCLEDSIQAMMDLTELPLRPDTASFPWWAWANEVCGRPRLEEKPLVSPLCSLLRLMMLSLQSCMPVDGLEGWSTAASGAIVIAVGEAMLRGRLLILDG